MFWKAYALRQGYNSGMSSVATNSSLWALVDGSPWIDASALLNAVKLELSNSPLDFRTRLLVRDSYRALEHHWGSVKLASITSDFDSKLKLILREDLGDPGFPTLEQRIVESVKPETILEFLRELGAAIKEPARLEIGGASSLILSGLLSRATEDIDVVNEIPSPIRLQHDLLSSLGARYGLSLTHFQSHYLPQGWEKRLRSLDRFDVLDVYLIDVFDIFVGKLFSNREKDLDDLRMLKRSLEKERIVDRLKTAAQLFAAEPSLRAHAVKNWHILFGETLPM
jgi:uncharacterized nucleotidyltransferase DUF6036